jgi:hypothetical protein
MTAARCQAVARPAVVLPAARFHRASRTVGASQRGSGFSRRAGAASLLIPHLLASRCGGRRLRMLSRPDANSGAPARVSGVARRSASDAVLCQSGLLARGCCGPIPPTDHQQRSKRPDRLSAIRPLTCYYLVAGAGFDSLWRLACQAAWARSSWSPGSAVSGHASRPAGGWPGGLVLAEAWSGDGVDCLAVGP